MDVGRQWACALAGAAALTISSSATAAPITAEQALARAAEASPLLLAAQAGATAAEARARQAGVSPNPELEIELEDALGTGPYRGFRGAELTLAFGQKFERGGKRAARQALASAEIDLAQGNLDRAKADLARDVRMAFADHLAARELARLASEAALRAEELARTARLLVETGRDPPLRQMRAEASLAQARAEEQRLAAEAQQAGRALAFLIGAPDDEGLEPLASPGLAPEPVSVPETRSIGIRIAEAERRMAEARVGVEHAAAIPDITARAGVRGHAESDDIAVVGGFSLPLNLRGQNRGAIDAARAELLGAEARLAQARLDAIREDRSARSQLAAADARVSALEGAGLGQAREAVRVARIGYAAGRFTLLEVLDAQAALNTTLSAIVEARRDRERALAAVARAQAR